MKHLQVVRRRSFLNALLVCGSLALLPCSTLKLAAAEKRPAVGETAPDFSLHNLADQSVQLSALTKDSPVVLVVLRGWPGYQCPICTKQVADFVARAADFKARSARVLMVYPGPADKLKAHARDFLNGKNWPEEFTLVTDPDFKFTNQYGLRWDAPHETAYPSTFVLDKQGVIRFAQTSTSHGGRATTTAVLQALDALK